MWNLYCNMLFVYVSNGILLHQPKRKMRHKSKVDVKINSKELHLTMV